MTPEQLQQLSGRQRACAGGGITGAGLCVGAAGGRGGELRLCRSKRGIHRSTSLSSAPCCALLVLASKLRIKRTQRRQERGRFDLFYLHCCDPLLEFEAAGPTMDGWFDAIAAILK
jgi:hypothetical protein